MVVITYIYLNYLPIFSFLLKYINTLTHPYPIRIRSDPHYFTLLLFALCVRFLYIPDGRWVEYF